ncbi:MAG: tRNA epoxyqueuosine(34) reductase QueG [Chthoniobacterales bacterium]|nr:MAG: tRNA epoxyqueuosine(34) reductase QueG [Chthoniobacterales bacterium]
MSSDLRDQVVVLASEIGFDLCRFTRADAPTHAREFRDWLEQGAAGEMNYLERNAQRRCDPQLVLPGVKTVIVVALNYFQEGRRSQTAATGRIARYAWGEDYHPLIEKKLKKLDEFLRGHGGVQKCYVDTGPMLERDHAAAAGIGWQGKSTMLLNRELGAWFFLAEILTTLEFAPSAPEANRCGTCTRCIAACPTGALTPHRLDARRCISYLTIELKGSIPPELRPLIGDRIYGCDECLDVCPWNRFARASREAAFQMRPEVAAMRLRDYLELDDERFRQLFRNSPIRRTKRRGLLRNVCVALGNVGTADDLPALRKAAAGPEPLIAEHAAWAIEQIESRAVPLPPRRTAATTMV